MTSTWGGAGRCERSSPHDPLAAPGAVVLDCCPPLLPVSMDIRGIDMSTGRVPAASTGVDVLFPGREPSSNGGGGTCWD